MNNILVDIIPLHDIKLIMFILMDDAHPSELAGAASIVERCSTHARAAHFASRCACEF
jgi:hypothetical protein